VVCGDIHTLHNNMEITEIKRRRQSYILSIHIIDLPTYILYASHTKHILYIHIHRAYILIAMFIIVIIFIILLRVFESLSLDVLI